MPGLLDLCEKYFKSRNLYEVLDVDKDVAEKEIKKAYHKVSLSVHPDKVDESDKAEATEKFKVLGKVHAILSDKNKKAVYDESGSIDEDDEVTERNWEEYWRILFKPITEEDIANYEKNYKGSEIEIRDVTKAYLEGKGDMDVIMDGTPFAHTADEPRLRVIIQGMIDSKELPAFKIFTHEPAQKKNRRHKRAEKEAKEVENINKMKEIEKEDKEKENNLTLMIRKKQEERGAQMDSFFDKLAAKYGGEDEKEQKAKKAVKSAKRKAATPGTRASTRTTSKTPKLAYNII